MKPSAPLRALFSFPTTMSGSDVKSKAASLTPEKADEYYGRLCRLSPGVALGANGIK